MDDARQAARRWVQRKRRFYTILGVYLALSVLWFAIDMLTGTDDLWFYWPVLGAGLIVAVIGIAMFGIGGLLVATGNGGRSTSTSNAGATGRTAETTRLTNVHLPGRNGLHPKEGKPSTAPGSSPWLPESHTQAVREGASA